MSNIKVYFGNRYITFRDTIPDKIEQKYGLFHNFHGRKDLYNVLSTFRQKETLPFLVIIHSDFSHLWKEFTSYFKIIEAAGGLVKNREGSFLIIKRRGFWDLPKGKISKKEAIEEAAVREVSEECGITYLDILVPLHQSYHTYMLKGKIVLKKTYWFTMKFTGDEELKPQLDEDITEALWIPTHKLDEILENTYPLVRDVINLGLGRNLSSFARS